MGVALSIILNNWALGLGIGVVLGIIIGTVWYRAAGRTPRTNDPHTPDTDGRS
ncbi:hypothetical protein ACEXQD_06410 [Herbiconiux sp. P15]|uniref:hypothetical protein n=1 Tax=Herbiconiux liukaitaii TaxID=3342799 RepID=UPI0035B9CF15